MIGNVVLLRLDLDGENNSRCHVWCSGEFLYRAFRGGNENYEGSNCGVKLVNR